MNPALLVAGVDLTAATLEVVDLAAPPVATVVDLAAPLVATVVDLWPRRDPRTCHAGVTPP